MLSHPLTDERISNLEAATKDAARGARLATTHFALERVQTIARALGGRRAARNHSEEAGLGGNRALALQGVSLLYGGDAAAAIPVLEKARGPACEEIDDDLALAHFHVGDLEGAKRVLEGRLEVAPEDVVARALLGEVLVASKDYVGAVRELERAARAAPELDRVQYDLGQAYGRGGNQALGVYHLARALEMRGEIHRAIAQYGKAAKALPADSDEALTAKQRLEALREVAQGRIVGR